MKKFHPGFFIIILCLLFIFESFPKAYAQEKTSEEFTLEEITVTAEKREVDVQKTAMAITAMTGDDISNQGITALDDALRG
jgi:iron complex outermembrane recepter protein